MRIFLHALYFASLLGCAKGRPTRSEPPVIDRSIPEPARVVGTWKKDVPSTVPNHYLWGPTSICDLLRPGGPIGLFHVDRLVSQMEALGDIVLPFTYVTLSVVEGLRGVSNGEQLVIRMQGGQMPDGKVSGTPVGLHVGETFFAFLDPVTSHNMGSMQLTPIAVFKRDGEGRFNNGQLFASTKGLMLDKLRDLVQTRLERCELANDVTPPKHEFVVAPSSPSPPTTVTTTTTYIGKGVPGETTPGPPQPSEAGPR